MEFNKKQKRSQLKKGDVLINLVGASIGRLAVFDVEVEVANVNQALESSDATGRRLSRNTSSSIFWREENNKRLVNNQSESARPNLSLTNLREFKFHIPSVDEQRRRIEKITSPKHAQTAQREPG